MSEKEDYYLNLNLSYLKILKTDIAKTEIISDFKVVCAENGLPILSKNGILYNSSKNPIEETVDLFKKLENNPENLCIIFGLELGYSLKYFSENFKGYIILFENDLELIKYVFQNSSLIEYISKQKFSIATSTENLKNMLKEIKKSDNIKHINIVANKMYSNIYKKFIAESYQYE